MQLAGALGSLSDRVLLLRVLGEGRLDLQVVEAQSLHLVLSDFGLGAAHSLLVQHAGRPVRLL